jgi:hypothetical protein
MEQATQAQIEEQQAEVRFAQERPGRFYGTLAAGAAAPLVLPALPEVIAGEGAFDAAGAAAEAPAIARGGVYALRDLEGTVMRTGRTGDLAR